MVSQEKRIGVVALAIHDRQARAASVNSIISQYADLVVGRMGVPYREKGVNIISVALDAPGNVISALSGKIGRLDGITAKTVYAPEGSIGKEENQ